MASITTTCSGGMRVVSLTTTPFSSSRSASGNDALRGNFGPPICFPAGRQRSGRRIEVKAMGGAAKYKGTQIREKKLTEMIESKVKEAKEVCEGDGSSDKCKVAWDEVEEVSQAMADLRRKLNQHQDPLEFYCEENPETDECRIYED